MHGCACGISPLLAGQYGFSIFLFSSEKFWSLLSSHNKHWTSLSVPVRASHWMTDDEDMILLDSCLSSESQGHISSSWPSAHNNSQRSVQYLGFLVQNSSDLCSQLLHSVCVCLILNREKLRIFKAASAASACSQYKFSKNKKPWWEFVFHSFMSGNQEVKARLFAINIISSWVNMICQ